MFLSEQYISVDKDMPGQQVAIQSKSLIAEFQIPAVSFISYSIS